MNDNSRAGSTLYELPLRIYYEDTDAAGIVYHANYLKFMERARTEWLRGLGYEQDELARYHGIAFVVRSAQLEYLAPARFNDELRVQTSVARLGRASIEFTQVIVDQTERSLCAGHIRVGCVDLQRMVARAMPKDIYTRICDGN